MATDRRMFRNTTEALTSHRMALQGDDRLHETRFWMGFYEDNPGLKPEVVERVLEDHFHELEKMRPDHAVDRLVKLAGGRPPQPPPRSNSEEWKNPTPPRNPDTPLTTADIVRNRAANRRQWSDANAYKIEERRRAGAPLDDARKEIARLKASHKEDAA